MNHEQLRLAWQLAGRVPVESAARFLGFQVHDIPVLVAAGLLKPLGNPGSTCVKYFSAVQLAQCYEDVRWLHRATAKIIEHWKNKNSQRNDNPKKTSEQKGKDIKSSATSVEFPSTPPQLRKSTLTH